MYENNININKIPLHNVNHHINNILYNLGLKSSSIQNISSNLITYNIFYDNIKYNLNKENF